MLTTLAMMAALMMPPQEVPMEWSAQCLTDMAAYAGETLDFYDEWSVEVYSERAAAMHRQRALAVNAIRNYGLAIQPMIDEMRVNEAAGLVPKGASEIKERQAWATYDRMIYQARNDNTSCGWPEITGRPIRDDLPAPVSAGSDER